MTKCKAGDMVSVEWEDAVSFGRIEAEAKDLPLPVFETYGKCGYIDSRKIVILHEQESPRDTMPDGVSRKVCCEPTALPMGMVRAITVYSKRRG
jgi:hypothetical protein